MKLVGRSAVTALLLSLVVASLSAQQGGGIVSAIARGASGRVRTSPSGAPPDVSDIAKRAAAIVVGTPIEARARVSDDGNDVYTDYVLSDATVLSGALAQNVARPGALAPVTVSVVGGTVEISGHKFTQTELGMPALEIGRKYVFLLDRLGSGYSPVGTYFGVFELGEVLRPVTTVEAYASGFRGRPAQESLAALVSAAIRR